MKDKWIKYNHEIVKERLERGELVIIRIGKKEFKGLILEKEKKEKN